MRWTGYVARTGKVRNAYRFPVGKPERKISFRAVIFNLGYVYPRGYAKTS
jgi:hypothetical protein